MLQKMFYKIQKQIKNKDKYIFGLLIRKN